jgi:hypothetical protein
MATSHAPVGVDHPTVVPTNFDPEPDKETDDDRHPAER